MGQCPGTLSDAEQQLLVRGSLSGQRPRRSERRRPRTFLSRGAKNTAGCPGMRLEATRGAGEDDPTQQDHCVRESQGNSRVKDHAENSCKPRYAKHETDVEQHSGPMVCETCGFVTSRESNCIPTSDSVKSFDESNVPPMRGSLRHQTGKADGCALDSC